MNVHNLCTTLMEPADLNSLLDLCISVVTGCTPTEQGRLAALEIIAELIVEKQKRRDNGEVIE